MELIRALRLDQVKRPQSVAFVGAGGKTTAIFQCARQLASPVLVTATTHLAVQQLDLADQYYICNDEMLDQLESELPPGITLLTGPVSQDPERTLGVSNKLLERIRTLAEVRQITLLIEADGSRQKALKAPADHEPLIPTFSDLVVVVAGLSALGKPLTKDFVHRPEIFATLSGLELGEIITIESIAQIMVHPDGGLKNIPSQSRRVALLNQADTVEQQAQADKLSSSLLSDFSAVITSSLAIPNSQFDDQSSIYAVNQPINAVILAAGGSRRFGSPKQLLDWHGKPLIWHVAQKTIEAGLNRVVIICGSEKDTIQQALTGLPVELIYNPDWEFGQGTSVRLGVQVAGTECGGILFLLSDQPHIPVSLMRALIQAHAKNLNPITGPIIDGQRANPVLFDRITFEDLEALSGDVGGRKLFGKYPVDWIPWYDPTPLFDIDTPEDYRKLLDMEL